MEEKYYVKKYQKKVDIALLKPHKLGAKAKKALLTAKKPILHSNRFSPPGTASKSRKQNGQV